LILHVEKLVGNIVPAIQIVELAFKIRFFDNLQSKQICNEDSDPST
jgi:hypothetical protein